MKRGVAGGAPSQSAAVVVDPAEEPASNEQSISFLGREGLCLHNTRLTVKSWRKATQSGNFFRNAIADFDHLRAAEILNPNNPKQHKQGNRDTINTKNCVTKKM